MAFNPLSDKRRGYSYVADPLGRVGQGSWVKKGDHFGRIMPEKQDRPSFDFSQPFNISSTVGMTGQNHRTDVARIENLLGRTGHLDLGTTDGPTGYFGTRMDQSIKGFQKQTGLKVDGSINPGGETINALKRAAGKADKTPVEKGGDKNKTDSKKDKPSWPERLFSPPTKLIDRFFPKPPIHIDGPTPGGKRG